MGLFRTKKGMTLPPWDKETQQLALRKSICTGEMTAGVMDKKTGAFHEWMKIEDEAAFRQAAGDEAIRVIY